MSATFFVEGLPIQQGSKKAFVVGGKARMVEAKDKELQPWRAAVKAAAEAADLRLDEETPARVDLLFYLPRPKSVKREFPITAADLDKLTRAINDALTKSRIIHDDSRIVTSTQKKRYADNRPIGVLIRVSEEKEI